LHGGKANHCGDGLHVVQVSPMDSTLSIRPK
jgi:hypothetical protein